MPSHDPPMEAGLYCPHCGYDLRGIESTRCPECGREFDRATLAASRIPWEHRREIGRFRALGRTLEWVTLHPGRLGAETARPVSWPDARRFRWVVVAAVLLPFALMLLLPLAWADAPDIAYDARQSVRGLVRNWEYRHGRTMALWLPVAQGTGGFSVAVGGALLVVMVSGMGGWFFAPRSLPAERQNRAVAISFYACAPLLWLVPAQVLIYIAMMLYPRLRLSPLLYLPPAMYLMGIVLACLALIIWWVNGAIMLRHATHATAARVLCHAAAMPLLLLLAVAYCSLGIPWVIGYVHLILLSLG